MSRHALLSGSYAILLSLLVAEPLRCGIPTVESFAAEVPVAVVITRGTTPHGFAYLSGGVSGEGYRPACDLGLKTGQNLGTLRQYSS
jgi:hypothetical protein